MTKLGQSKKKDPKDKSQFCKLQLNQLIPWENDTRLSPDVMNSSGFNPDSGTSE